MGTTLQVDQKFRIDNLTFRKAIQPEQLIKVRPEAEGEALKATRFNGADELAFKYQGDLYIASGRDLDLLRLGRLGRDTTINGQPVKVVKVDDEITSGKEGMSDVWQRMIGPGSIEIPFAAMGALVGGLYGAIKGATTPKADQVSKHGQPVTDGPFAR